MPTMPLMTDLRSPRVQGWVPDLSTFGARLALVRQRMGWGNVKQAAQLCGIAVETWRAWERDNIEPKALVSACMKIAGVTGVDYRWLALGPLEQPEGSEGQAERSTHGYRSLGPRVVVTGMPDRRITSDQDHASRRTRPIDRSRLTNINTVASAG